MLHIILEAAACAGRLTTGYDDIVLCHFPLHFLPAAVRCSGVLGERGTVYSSTVQTERNMDIRGQELKRKVPFLACFYFARALRG